MFLVAKRTHYLISDVKISSSSYQVFHDLEIAGFYSKEKCTPSCSLWTCNVNFVSLTLLDRKSNIFSDIQISLSR